MDRQTFRRLCEEKILVLDGATGSNLQKAGMPTGVCPEAWILAHPDIFMGLQKEYAEAGSDIVLAPTFTANRIKLEEYGLDNQLWQMNMDLVALSKKAVDGKALVAGDLTMTGQQLAPVGPMPFETLVEIYKEQAAVLCEAGVDLFIIETMMSLNETRAALIAIREVCDLPVMATMTFNEDGRTMFGTNAETAMTVLQSLGADAVGMNCSTGPEKMKELVIQMKSYANIPVIVKPNAGMPELIDGHTVYGMSPEDFAADVSALTAMGAGIVGGCCGTTPEHIRMLADAVRRQKPPVISEVHRRVLASERQVLEITQDGLLKIIGERINPTGKKKLQEALRQKNMDYVSDMARAQEEKGAAVLDINMGMNGIDEKEMMLMSIETVTQAVNLPLCIDSSHVDVIEAALRIYPGRALINSISLEKAKIEDLLPIAAKYGAMFILLPLSDAGLPKNFEERRQIIHTIMDRAVALGCHKEDIVVDGLVATVGANKKSALETLETVGYCSEVLHLATACGLSNISFGLPERTCVNTAFLTLMIGRGLTMAIANPSQDMLMNAAAAADMLMFRQASDMAYITRMQQLAHTENADTAAVKAQSLAPEKIDIVYEDVLKGQRGHIIAHVEDALKEGMAPAQIINEHLIPAINAVGELFNRGDYFLPQLISSAETMKMAIEYIQPMLENTEGEEKAAIVIATVEGDIHDIGKNLVALMLKNYGYRVIDLGKDVAAEIIVDTAVKTGAAVIGLSALMTTTMMRMKDVVTLAKEKGCTSKIIIGGAVITQSFADEIGADGYSTDAADAVRLVETLLA